MSELRFQFVQQTAPYLLKQHFVTWGSTHVDLVGRGLLELDARRAEAEAELAKRLPTKPWSVLATEVAPGTLDGFGGPLSPKWMVEAALVRKPRRFFSSRSSSVPSTRIRNELKSSSPI